MSHRFFITDVFAEKPYGGNQLATVFDAADIDTAEMQQIARAFNFSETTFITGGDLESGFDVRIFTPNSEIPFAGHPTLGTAFLIREKLLSEPAEKIRLNLGVGPIPVSFGEDGVNWMRQNPPEFGDTFESAGIAAALNLCTDDLLPDFSPQSVSTGIPFLIVPIQSLDALKRIVFDAAAYDRIVPDDGPGAALAYCLEGHDPVQSAAVRVFAPRFGVPEDPATGSANGCLAGYLVEHGVVGSDAIDLTVGQGYEIDRPSQLYLKAAKSADGVIEVNVGGRVNAMAEGTWNR